MKQNFLLVEFDFIIDLDIAIFRYLKDKFYNSDLVVNRATLDASLHDQIRILLQKPMINPLELIMDKRKGSYTDLYLSLTGDNVKEILPYAVKSNMFSLMELYLDETTSTDIDILCFNEDESKFIKSLNPRFNTVVSSRKNINISKYTVLYLKHYIHAIEYENLNGKNIYVADMRCNMDPLNDYTMDSRVSMIVEGTNVVRVMAQYKNIKFNRNMKWEVRTSGNDKKDAQ